MAQTVKIILEDDIDGGSADETIRFGLDGGQYEIDLNSANATKLREALRPYVSKARRASAKTNRGATTRPTRSQPRDPQDSRVGQGTGIPGVRSWTYPPGHPGQVLRRSQVSRDLIR